MLRVLLVKTSSLGDVVHNFPVVTDLRRHFPDALIDWVVEEPFVPLARMHPAVRRVIPVAVRRWRTRLLGRATWKEIAEFRRLSQSERYDAIIDSQGLLKSALIARAACGRRHGFDAATAREPLAARFYDVTHHVARSLHAVVRNRLLAGAALGYRIESAVDYGLPSSDPSVGRPGPTCVLLHGTSRADKHWPVASWIDLGRRLEAAGIGGGGVRGRLRARGLGLIYLSTVRAWFRDDQADMAKAVSALDRALDRADFLVKSAPFINCLGAPEPPENRAEPTG